MTVGDLLFRGGPIWTGREGAGLARALAVRGGRILAVGSEAEVSGAIGRPAVVVELAGRALLPGLVDSHTHFVAGGFKLSGVDLREAATPAELVDGIAAFARRLGPGRWITGGDWDHERWGGELPRAEWIDAVTPANPVFVNRTDAHMALANSLALVAGGVDAGTPDPPGGRIVRDPATGAPSGILKDQAMGLVARVVPQPTNDQRDAALAAATRHALSLGVTQVHDVGTLGGDPWQDLDAYRRARDGERLGLRVYSMVPLDTWERMREYVAVHGRGDERLRWGGVKGFVDGSLGSGTAWFHEPYVDAPDTCGLTVTDPGLLGGWIQAADAAGLHVAVHAIGDRANDWLLDVCGRTVAVNGARDRRLRVEHAQHLTPAAIGRFADLGVIASMQPYHLADDGRWAERRIGPERARTAYAFRSLLDAGAPLAFGSDWTVAPLNPLAGLAAAVGRRTLDGAHPRGWVPEERITLAEALTAYTRGAAYAGFMEAHTGVLRRGASADLVVLSGDPFAAPPEELTSLFVEETYVEGERVHPA